MHAQLEAPQGSINLSPCPRSRARCGWRAWLCAPPRSRRFERRMRSPADRLVSALPALPVFTVKTASDLIGRSEVAVGLAVTRLLEVAVGLVAIVPSKRWASSRPSRALSGSWRALTPTRRARHLCDPCLRGRNPECHSHASVTPTTAGPRQARSGPRGDRAARLGSRAGSCVRTRSGIDRPARRREHSCKGRQAG